jgi:hypothetical protein
MAQTIVTENPASGSPEKADPAALVRLIADTDAAPGVRTDEGELTPVGGEPIRLPASVIVRPPVSLRVRESALAIAPGQPAALFVAVQREAGVDEKEPVTLSLDLPKGVKVADPNSLKVPADKPGAEIRLELEGGEAGPESPVAVAVTAKIRMPRGPVRVESANRPMLSRAAAEK